MKTKCKKLSEEEIDETVVAQAGDESAWEKPVKVKRAKTASFMLPSALTARATFLARLHHEENLQNWLKRVIQERVDIEEAAFTGVKRELLSKSSH